MRIERNNGNWNTSLKVGISMKELNIEVMAVKKVESLKVYEKNWKVTYREVS